MAADLGTFTKSAAEVLRIPVDFGDTPQLVAGASGGAPSALVMSVNIASQTVACAGSPGTPPTVSGVQRDYGYQISALFSGGTAGTYTVTYTITLDDPDGITIQRTATLKVT